MTGNIRFTLNAKTVEAKPGESIWQVAKREGVEIEHLCHKNATGYRADGNCRACMVEIEGERVLAASCQRTPTEGMVVDSENARAKSARRLVVELLLADQPNTISDNPLAEMAARHGLESSRFPALEPDHVPLLDDSHVAMRVNLDACISCGLCVRACREVQVNGVIGMGGRGHGAFPIFDQGDDMGASTCVACGECVQACPTDALLPAKIAEGFEREIATICPFCGVGCQINAKVSDGKISVVEGLNGPANEGRLCVKGRFGFDYITHPHRLTKPLIRRADAPEKGLNIDPANPLTHFREATWDEALEVAAKGLATVREIHGGEAVSGFGSAKCTNEEAYLFQRLIRQGFGHNHVDHCTRLCHASSVSALLENVGSGAVTAPFTDVEHADVVIVIGSNATENHPVAATYFKQFVARGGTLIVMDPRGQALKQHAAHMLQFRPGADVSMLNAIMSVIAEEGLQDDTYIERMTEGWDEMRAHLKDFAPEDMAEICGIDASTLRAVAHAFGRAKAGMIFWGMGVSQHTHGTDNARCLISLALMTGNVGRPGTGLHPLRGQNNVQGASDAGLIPMFLPDYKSVKDPEVLADFSQVWQADNLSGQPGLTVVEILDAAHRGDIRAMYIAGENPAMSDPDTTHVREALARLDFLVSQDIFITETANFADVILPAAAFAEKTGTVTNTNRQVQMGRKVVPAPGEAKPDWWIISELGKRLGVGWDFASPEEVYVEMGRLMPSLNNISWDRLERENSVTYPSLSPDDPGQKIVFGDGFPRAGGRAKFTPAKVLPPAEQPDTEYPMILTTGRQLEHWHTGSMTRRAGVLDALEPEASASLHPATLRDMDVEPGAHVLLTTRRGTLSVMARADSAIARDMVFLPFAYVEAAANILTNPALDPYGKIAEVKFAAVRVEKA